MNKETKKLIKELLETIKEDVNSYQIWINSPLLSERQENYLGIGFDNLDNYKDWKFAVCNYNANDCETQDEIFTSLELSEVINFLKEQE